MRIGCCCLCSRRLLGRPPGLVAAALPALAAVAVVVAVVALQLPPPLPPPGLGSSRPAVAAVVVVVVVAAALVAAATVVLVPTWLGVRLLAPRGCEDCRCREVTRSGVARVGSLPTVLHLRLLGAVLGQLLVDEAWWRPHLLGAVAEYRELVDEVAERLPTRRHAADRLTPKDVPVALLEQRLLN